jgi:hypothetical protein
MMEKLTSPKLTMVTLFRGLTMAKLTMLAKTYFSIFLSNGRDVPQVPRIINKKISYVSTLEK